MNKPKIIICDLNKDFIDQIKAANIVSNYVDIEVVCADILEIKKQNPKARIVTASNPQFSPDGGLDAILAKNFDWTQAREFNLTKDLFFVRSVDETRKASDEIIFRALVGLFLHRHLGDYILPVLGCGIGVYAITKFINYLARVLRSADLRSADLSSANLSSADLRSANLRSANLSSANLSYADLRYADLRSANLRSADLSSADLSSANLSYADLRYADLRSANLSSTDFDGLTVNEWLKKYKIKKVGTKIIVYKGVNNGLQSSTSDKKITYKIGKTTSEKLCSFSVAAQCMPGLHVCPTIEAARGWGSTVLECEVDMGDIVAIPAQDGGIKIRVKKLKPIKIIN